MGTLAVWWAAISLESLILLRSGRSTILRTYPFFYAYLALVLASDIILLSLYTPASLSTAYTNFYWTKEFVCVIAGYGLVLEIIERALASHEGARRFARSAGLIVFASIVGFTLLQLIIEHQVGHFLTHVEVERNLRSAELVLLGLVMAMIFYYGTPVQRNLKGIMLGYGFCISIIVMDHAVRSYAGASFQTPFSYIRSYSYLISLLIWTWALWSPDERSTRDKSAPPPASADYGQLAGETRNALEAMRGQLGKAGGS